MYIRAITDRLQKLKASGVMGNCQFYQDKSKGVEVIIAHLAFVAGCVLTHLPNL
jgi:hypothetical protein